MTKTAERTTATPGGNDCLNPSIPRPDDNRGQQEENNHSESDATYHY